MYVQTEPIQCQPTYNTDCITLASYLSLGEAMHNIHALLHNSIMAKVCLCAVDLFPVTSVSRALLLDCRVLWVPNATFESAVLAFSLPLCC